MKKAFFTLIIPLLITMSFPLSGQDTENVSSRLNVLESLTKSRDRETKELALTGLEEMVDKGVTNQELDRILELLTILANEGITNISYEGINKNELYPGIREGAARILGKTKDSRALNPLVNIIFYDDNVQVIMAAVEAASKIQPDQAGRLSTAYGRILKNTRLIYNNEELIQFTINAISASGSMDGNIYKNQDIPDGLDFVSQSFSGYGRSTRNMAGNLLEVIDTLNISAP